MNFLESSTAIYKLDHTMLGIIYCRALGNLFYFALTAAILWNNICFMFRFTMFHVLP